MDNTPLSFEALASLSGLPGRTVRYYIQRGLVDRPSGNGRGAHYTGRHLEQLLQVRKWTEAGLSLDRIAALGSMPDLPPLQRRAVGEIAVRSHVRVAEGIDLVISPDETVGLTPERMREITRRVVAACRDVLAEKNTGEEDAN